LARKQVLLIGGSLNQTTMMHRIGVELSGRYACTYSPFYCDGLLLRLKRAGFLDFTILAGRFRELTEEYLRGRREGGGREAA
jgi:hypothetical protein